MTERAIDLQEQARRNLAEMDQRVAEASARLNSGTYPMTPDNPCLNMTEAEFKAYIRTRRAEFEERHKNDPPKGLRVG